MRMRFKPYARPELNACPFSASDPIAHKGSWHHSFARPAQPMYMELGCGKGTYAARVAADHPEINLLAIDIKSDILAVARRNIQLSMQRQGVRWIICA